MARKPRLDSSGCVHHVMGRGNGGSKIFSDDTDRVEFLRLLGEGVERFGHTIYAYCLMGNHFHLVVRTGGRPLSAIMQNLMFRFTRHFNKRTKRYGHLFQGRFKSILLDEQSYLLELVRYVHLNPVRAGLVKRPEDWRWSGHRAYLGRAKEPFIDTDWVLGILGGTKATARRRYAAFVLEGMGEERRDDFHVGGDEAGVLGDEEFLKRLHFVNAKKKRPVPSLEVVVDAVCESMDLSTAALKAPGRERQASYGRALVGLLSQDLKAASLTEVADYTGRDVTTLSRAVGILRRRLRDDVGEARKVDSISRKLTRSVEAGNNANTQA